MSDESTPLAKGDASYLASNLIEADLRRLAIAQHWARAALLSEPETTWSPILVACALAALAARDLHELRATLDAAIGRMGANPRTANVWRAAAGELVETMQGEGIALESPHDWAWSLIGERVRIYLDDAQRTAEMPSGFSPPEPAK
jgi:hypothetical protein